MVLKYVWLPRLDTLMQPPQGIDPSVILAITFTTKAATEIRERLARAGIDPGDLTACTFHSFCYRVLQRYYKVMVEPWWRGEARGELLGGGHSASPWSYPCGSRGSRAGREGGIV